MVAGGVLVLLVALVAVLRGTAVLARERAEAAADLAALAAADGIGIDGSSSAICARAEPIVAGNHARLAGCVVRLAGSGRTGTVDVTVAVRVRLAAIGNVVVHARARAGRLNWTSQQRGPRPSAGRHGQIPAGRQPGTAGDTPPTHLLPVDPGCGRRVTRLVGCRRQSMQPRRES